MLVVINSCLPKTLRGISGSLLFQVFKIIEVALKTRQPLPGDQLQELGLFFRRETITADKSCRVTVQLDGSITFRAKNVDLGRV